jgi:hypothetical protein
MEIRDLSLKTSKELEEGIPLLGAELACFFYTGSLNQVMYFNMLTISRTGSNEYKSPQRQ